MTNFIPIFPLNIVVFPTEEVNLHIFEPRYKQLIEHCINEHKPFGIPSVSNNKINDVGTLVEIISIEKKHEQGELDIKTKATSQFNILEIINNVPDKLYKGAIVTYPENELTTSHPKMKEILTALRLFHSTLKVEKKYKKNDEELTSYDIAHHVGFTLEEEYTLLTLLNETARQEYILQHLKKSIPAMQELISLKERIKLNGHFRKLSLDNNDL
jgi:Lon protease-like protein